QVLRGDVEGLAPPVQFRDGSGGNPVGRIGPVGEAPEYAGVNEKGHYSYSPSLLRAESGTETPQSMAAPNSRRSHSSRGSTAGLGRNRSRSASRAKTSGATPRRRACSFRA